MDPDTPIHTDKLQRAQVRILGVLLNRLEEREAGSGDKYDYYYPGYRSAYGEDRAEGGAGAVKEGTKEATPEKKVAKG